eukprot:scaffold31574_cov124-Isochrysis_galbana.AAC.4
MGGELEHRTTAHRFSATTRSCICQCTPPVGSCLAHRGSKVHTTEATTASPGSASAAAAVTRSK